MQTASRSKASQTKDSSIEFPGGNRPANSIILVQMKGVQENKFVGGGCDSFLKLFWGSGGIGGTVVQSIVFKGFSWLFR